jgi:predicted phosphate transport protein (TIGR00153 family)
MRFSLRPKDTSFYDLFDAAAANLLAGTDLLTELAAPGAEVESLSERLAKIEHDSDALTHDLYNRLNSVFVTPFDREDIYALGSGLDDVMDHIEAVGSLLYLYGLTTLPVLPSEMQQQITILGQQAQLAVESLPRLRSMKDLSAYWTECDRLEYSGDKVYRMLLVRLFSGEYDALTVMKLKEVADELEGACDAFEHVSHIVQTIAVKES